MDAELVDIEALQRQFYEHPANRLQLLIKMRASGCKWNQISEKLGVSKTTCQRALKKDREKKAGWEEWRQNRRALRGVKS